MESESREDVLLLLILFFADDSLIFFKANKQSCNFIKESLNDYEKTSGQLINYDKSSITFSKDTPPCHIQYIKEKLHLSVARVTNFIWGFLPSLFVARDFSSVISETVAKKINGW